MCGALRLTRRDEALVLGGNFLRLIERAVALAVRVSQELGAFSSPRPGRRANDERGRLLGSGRGLPRTAGELPRSPVGIIDFAADLRTRLQRALSSSIPYVERAELQRPIRDAKAGSHPLDCVFLRRSHIE